MIEERLAQARAARRTGDVDQAIIFQTEAVDVLRVGADLPALAHAVRHLADMLIDAGRTDEAGFVIMDMLELYAGAPDIGALDRANAVRLAAVHHESVGNADAARRAWALARLCYAALDDEIRRATGSDHNPGVDEANARLAALA